MSKKLLGICFANFINDVLLITIKSCDLLTASVFLPFSVSTLAIKSPLFAAAKDFISDLQKNIKPADKDMHSMHMLDGNNFYAEPSCPPPPYEEVMQGRESGGLYTKARNTLKCIDLIFKCVSITWSAFHLK